MHLLLVLSFAVAALAAPQGYNYQPQAPVHYQQQVSAPAPVVHSAPAPAYHAAPAPTYHAPATGALGGTTGFATGSAPTHFGGGGSVGAAAGAQHTIVSKTFYIHSAPEESEDEASSQTIGGGPAHKNYKIVFIKAPSQTSSAAAISLAQAQNEEKTAIYVLTKKTDAADLQASVAEANNVAHKPEVFFIKYKTPEEAQHAQSQIQAQYDALGGTSQVSDEGFAPVQSFIGALGHTGGGGAVGGGIGGGVGAIGGGGPSFTGSASTNFGASAPHGYLPPSF